MLDFFQERETIDVCAVVLGPSIRVLLARHREVSHGKLTASSWCITRETRMTRTASSRLPLIIFQDTALLAPAKSQVEGRGKSQCAKTIFPELSAKLLDDSIHKIGADCHEGEVHCSCDLTSDNISNLKTENSVVSRDDGINEAMLMHLVSAQQRPYHEQSVQVIWTRLGLQESLQNNSICFGLPQVLQERGPFQWYKTPQGCGSGRWNPKDKAERAASSAATSITK